MNDSGSCRCRAVSFTLRGEVKAVINCHCSICRKINGSAFSTYVIVAEDDIVLNKGAADIGAYAVSNNATKYFCRNCGTPLYNRNPVKYSGVKILHLGALSKQYTPQINIYCDTKLSWLDDISVIKSFDQARQT